MAESPHRRRPGTHTAKKPGKPRLKRDPQLWGLLAGALAAVGVFSHSVWSAWPQVVIHQPGLIIGVLLTFVISYALAGICAYLLIDLVERELSPSKKQGRAGKTGQASHSEDSAPVVEAPSAPDQRP